MQRSVTRCNTSIAGATEECRNRYGCGDEYGVLGQLGGSLRPQPLANSAAEAESQSATAKLDRLMRDSFESKACRVVEPLSRHM